MLKIWNQRSGSSKHPLAGLFEPRVDIPLYQYVTDPLKVEMAHVDTAVLQGLGCSVLYFALLTLAVSCIVLGNGTVGSFFRRLVL